MRRLFRHTRTLTRGRVTRAHGDANINRSEALQMQLLGDAIERLLEIFLDIVAECLERRHIENLDAFAQFAIKAALEKHVDSGVKSRESLTAACRRGDQSMPPCPNLRPSVGLRFCRLPETFLEPRPTSGVKIRKACAVLGRIAFHVWALMTLRHCFLFGVQRAKFLSRKFYWLYIQHTRLFAVVK